MQNVEIEKILEILNVKSLDEGVKKLIKMLRIFDLLVTKYTEYEILIFLKYDDIFNSLL